MRFLWIPETLLSIWCKATRYMFNYVYIYAFSISSLLYFEIRKLLKLRILFYKILISLTALTIVLLELQINSPQPNPFSSEPPPL